MCKILIVINLILILISLFSGVVFLARDNGQTNNRIVTSLTIRVSLSACLIVLMLTCYFTGNLQPNTLYQ